MNNNVELTKGQLSARISNFKSNVGVQLTDLTGDLSYLILTIGLEDNVKQVLYTALMNGAKNIRTALDKEI